MFKCPSGPPITFRATPLTDIHTISPLPIWRPMLILEGPEIQITPDWNRLFSTGPLRRCGTRWMESSILPPIPLSTQKLCKVNHLPPSRYTPKLSLLTPLRNKWSLYTCTRQIDHSRINSKKPQIIVFIVFFNWKIPCTHLWTSKLSTHIQLHHWRCYKSPRLPSSLFKAFSTIHSH